MLVVLAAVSLAALVLRYGPTNSTSAPSQGTGDGFATEAKQVILDKHEALREARDGLSAPLAGTTSAALTTAEQQLAEDKAEAVREARSG